MSKSRLQLNISEEAKRNLRIYCAMSGITQTEAIEHLLIGVLPQMPPLASKPPTSVQEQSSSPEV